jgi:ParB-like chromosome segregation protein Spo0J
MTGEARQPVVVRLPTELVTRYRAVDREFIGAPAYVVDTPRHLDALTEDIRQRGILVPLQLSFSEDFGALDGNHRIAVAIRLGLADVPVELIEKPINPRPDHAKPMQPQDPITIRRAISQ